ncbi:MAG: hypothetical protein RRA15_10610 [bacterium]|nr:hypothetical protein [bacterium]MDT8366927.1 hypothetical protein [bacterium]
MLSFRKSSPIAGLSGIQEDAATCHGSRRPVRPAEGRFAEKSFTRRWKEYREQFERRSDPGIASVFAFQASPRQVTWVTVPTFAPWSYGGQAR